MTRKGAEARVQSPMGGCQLELGKIVAEAPRPSVIIGSEEVGHGAMASTEPSGLGNDLIINWEKVVEQLKSMLEAVGGDSKVQGEEYLEFAEMCANSSSIRCSP